jgi:hypothetical protein
MSSGGSQAARCDRLMLGGCGDGCFSEPALFRAALAPALRGRVSTIVWQPGTTRSSSWLRARYMDGVSPTSSVNRAEKEPRLVQPTAKQTSVTLRSPRRSSAFARSMRRVMR